MAHIITLTGPAHSGKTTISNMFMECKDDYFSPVCIPKYTTRIARKDEKDVICREKIPKECDLVYEQYGVRYGVELETFYKELEKGKTPIIVINDIRAVEDLKAVFGSLVFSVFMYRKPAIYNELYMEEKERASFEIPESEIENNARIRYEKAQAIYRIYIENIYLFDKVILNTYHIEDTRIQVKHIIKKLIKNFSGLYCEEK